MGDISRNIKFSQFLIRTFSKAKSFCVVADGKGELARKLANKGIKTTVYDPKPRLAGRKHKRIAYLSKAFHETTPVNEDVIVGMHPDEAASEIILAANRLRKPFAIVPCCIKGRHSANIGSYADWLKKLSSLSSRQVSSTQLKINGKNIILFCK
jgi:hypothetical protein